MGTSNTVLVARKAHTPQPRGTLPYGSNLWGNENDEIFAESEEEKVRSAPVERQGYVLQDVLNRRHETVQTVRV